MVAKVTRKLHIVPAVCQSGVNNSVATVIRVSSRSLSWLVGPEHVVIKAVEVVVDTWPDCKGHMTRPTEHFGAVEGQGHKSVPDRGLKNICRIHRTPEWRSRGST